MDLRKLEKKDIDGMLEWMHDKEISSCFRFDASTMTRDKAENFIAHSFEKGNYHYAIVNDQDEYLGTVSLKNINYEDRNAEYAISTRKCAWGTGAAREATKKILRIAFEELELQKVYLNVMSSNSRAVRFYEKMGFSFCGESKKHIQVNGEFMDLKWFEIQREDNALWNNITEN